VISVKAVLEIELIGDNSVQEIRQWNKLTNSLIPGLGDATFGSVPPAGWVAEITGFDPKYRYARSFLKFKKDYSRANSKGSRGVYAEYILDEGKIYDVKQSVTWKRSKRYFCTVKDWQIVEMTEQEVIDILNKKTTLNEVKEWLNNTCQSTSTKPPNNE
jgi:hypothetical protein